MINTQGEKLTIAFWIIYTSPGTATTPDCTNRLCPCDWHNTNKCRSRIVGLEIVVRDANYFIISRITHGCWEVLIKNVLGYSYNKDMMKGDKMKSCVERWKFMIWGIRALSDMSRNTCQPFSFDRQLIIMCNKLNKDFMYSEFSKTCWRY